MDVGVIVINWETNPDTGKMRAVWNATDGQGNRLNNGLTDVDSGSSAAQVNAAIVAAAKAQLTATFGTVFQPSDKIMLSGGVNFV